VVILLYKRYILLSIMKRNKSIKRSKSISNASFGLRIIVINELVSDFVSMFRSLFRIGTERKRRDTIVNLSKIHVSG
jgi:hypothetical protein